MIQKVKTGIPGLDKILYGGMPQGKIILVSGGAGTGKSILSLEYIYRGAKEFKEPGVYISTEQTEEEFLLQAKEFGWDLEPLLKKKLIKIVKIDVTDSINYFKVIKDAVNKIKAKRLVIDSLTTITEFLTPVEVKKSKGTELIDLVEKIYPVPVTENLIAKSILLKFLDGLKELNCTALVTSELPEQSNFLSRDTVSEFLCDGVIVLYYVGIGGEEYNHLQIRKMRYSNFIRGYFPLKFTNKGLEIMEEGVSILMK